MEKIKVGVLGAGTMGAGIAQVAAQSGHNVVLVDVNEIALEKAQGSFQSIFSRMIEKGKMTAEAIIEQYHLVIESPEIDLDMMRTLPGFEVRHYSTDSNALYVG